MAKSFKYKDDNYLDSTGIVHNKELLSNILNKKVYETGVIYSSEMTNAAVGTSEVKYFDLTYKNKYENLPTIITTFLSGADIGYYGYVNTYVVDHSNTKARIVLGVRLNNTTARVGYLVVSND